MEQALKDFRNSLKKAILENDPSIVQYSIKGYPDGFYLGEIIILINNEITPLHFAVADKSYPYICDFTHLFFDELFTKDEIQLMCKRLKAMHEEHKQDVIKDAIKELEELTNKRVELI